MKAAIAFIFSYCFYTLEGIKINKENKNNKNYPSNHKTKLILFYDSKNYSINLKKFLTRFFKQYFT